MNAESWPTTNPHPTTHPHLTTNPHPDPDQNPLSVADFAEDFGARWSELTARWAARPGTSVATLGPAGTSSHLAAESLALEHELRIELFPSFEDVLSHVSTRKVALALVPSAYRGVTRFHWHRDLRLAAFFPLATPEYGLAVRPDGAPAGTGPVSVAAMWEVRWMYDQVMPPSLAEREVRWIEAESTQHAAAITARGGADLALTNAPGRRAHGLRWLLTRPGAEIIWALFTHADDHTGR
ncbi:hypothetical protein Caci_3670 [Catenulispora acidiphila DSM 44928]|uniref:Prephenate dehydratase domain-containing protein n=1 Tax=Catenulispora acidiphila (strain DSM 44928 / JCM 14897 / NBRC 102108 / NRRL B-24433 / ID139908) TaxID=479433 RepID=C7QBV3_CATAD|nr:hypothetical protein Caci_3670 [Catenulispora acidiphila DSM 44928]